ncbi:MAG: EVE domain-containing protein [Synechococcus sp.]|nr:EVE domain-containing protein [Synechococcus sp.]
MGDQRRGRAWWLMKSEPAVYGIHHLEREGSTLWDGIRNYQARNFMRSMQPGDLAFFYHSNTSPAGIIGLMEVIETGLIDPSQFDPTSRYFDPASRPEQPRWDCVRLVHRRSFRHLLSLEELRQHFDPESLPVLRRGNRLSILPVSEASAQQLLALLGEKPLFAVV